MSLGPWQIIIIALVILVLFGRGRISEMMGDFGKGIKSFKEGVADTDSKSAAPSPRIEGPAENGTVDPVKQPDSSDTPR
ncbi:twin-arginine translocase TatA/TatE family subunit [Parerythrobacter lacustris]|uniref:Sec-independent protein translocase protein TatA n=1 Tax=Parerythrobacter lacustris TaxID=2969984 RepID=A0ABT1XUH4_9SPHN|nr:twin-arginine translocase TatA/TatE family subunit [Parerythrobacter lacustris]MCR2834877.1 twin-arginine translocase TatA/TatE family subunit [Parerythrobacter lacustris]